MADREVAAFETPDTVELGLDAIAVEVGRVPDERHDGHGEKGKLGVHVKLPEAREFAMTFPFTTIGPLVLLNPLLASATTVSHTTVPVRRQAPTPAAHEAPVGRQMPPQLD